MYFKGFHKILHVLVLIFSYVGLETCKKYPNLGILTLFFFYIQNKRLPCEQHAYDSSKSTRAYSCTSFTAVEFYSKIRPINAQHLKTWNTNCLDLAACCLETGIISQIYTWQIQCQGSVRLHTDDYDDRPIT